MICLWGGISEEKWEDSPAQAGGTSDHSLFDSLRREGEGQVRKR